MAGSQKMSSTEATKALQQQPELFQLIQGQPGLEQAVGERWATYQAATQVGQQVHPAAIVAMEVIDVVTQPAFQQLQQTDPQTAQKISQGIAMALQDLGPYLQETQQLMQLQPSSRPIAATGRV